MGIGYHLGILGSAWIQLRTFRYLNNKEREEQVSHPFVDVEEEKDEEIDPPHNFTYYLNFTKKILESFYANYLILVCYLVLMLASFLGNVDVMDLGFFFFFHSLVH